MVHVYILHVHHYPYRQARKTGRKVFAVVHLKHWHLLPISNGNTCNVDTDCVDSDNTTGCKGSVMCICLTEESFI